MSRGINKVILIGNTADEPILRQTSTGLAVAHVTMVTNEVRRNPESGQTVETAEWHRIVLFGKLAEISNNYLRKGTQLYIEGRLKTHSYVDKQNIKRIVTEVLADEMQMLGSKAFNNAVSNTPENAIVPNSVKNNLGATPQAQQTIPKAINSPLASDNIDPPVTAVNNYDSEIPF